MSRRTAARTAANARFIITLSIATAEPSDARPDVRQVGELEEALHGAVLAVGAVQQREHDVDVERRRAQPARGAEDPAVDELDTGTPSTANAAGSASAPASSARAPRRRAATGRRW